jgi:hypothetical protein
MIHKDDERKGVFGGVEIQMSPFEAAPTSKFRGRRRVWKLTKPLDVSITGSNWAQDIHVPVGYETDFGTIPIFLQMILGNRDTYVEVFTVHDMLCDYEVPGFVANSILRTMMLLLGAPYWKRLAFYIGLQLFGYQSPTSRLVAKAKALLTDATQFVYVISTKGRK